jgi:hypothetical protein
MKTFIYKEIAYHNRTRNNREAIIYKIKNNRPEFVGCVEFSTASTRGAQHECFNYLMNAGYIPKKYYKSSLCAWRGEGYFFGEVTKHYNIIKI